MKYVHPKNSEIHVRVMPGNPKSPNPRQKNAYVIQQKSGRAYTKEGAFVSISQPESHIPLEEFIFRK